MEAIVAILQFAASAAGAITGTVSAYNLVAGYLRSVGRSRRTADVLKFLQDLGATSESEVRSLVEAWDPPEAVPPAVRDELTGLLINLTRGARFHTTQGTPLSSYLRCERLIDQLILNLQPRRRAGDTLPGGWRLTHFLGMGSFGEVWAGTHTLHPDRRAFKFFTHPGARDWFTREGTALFAVQNMLRDCPNVIKYLDVAQDGDPYPYLVLEFVGGGSLEDWLLAPATDGTSVDVAEVIGGVARGLAAAHRHHIYHRDLKPANVLLTPGPDPVPKIADFGLSRVEPEPAAGSAVASQGVVVGTRMYLPPEAADPFERRDPGQDDVFAFGVLWYQVLTRRLERPPYDFADRLHQAEVDSRTVRLVSRCLACPDRRYQDAGQLLTELDAEAAPGPGEWPVPDDGFEVGAVAREFVNSLAR